ncbi:MAG: helix-turn-helix domain-containing protein [Desulfarculus sp.]|nr:MAG: helix-turn-helix domain-containing protein [Desulfarculus sp.]
MRPERVDFLSGWTAIAVELGVCERTVRRWHQRYGLPVEFLGNNPTTTRAKLQAWADHPNSRKGGRKKGRDA